MNTSHTKHTRQRGFSLLEVLIVVTIVSVLVGIALPSYQNSAIKTRRAEGQSLLLEAAHIMERHFTEFGRYGDTIIFSLDEIPAGEETARERFVLVQSESENGFYTISQVDSRSETSTFLITAQAQGGQTADPCGDLTLDHTGVRGITGI